MMEILSELLKTLLVNQFIAGGILMQVWLSIQNLLNLLITYIWNKIKKRILDRVYFTVTIDEYDELAKHIELFCAKHNQSNSHSSAKTSSTSSPNVTNKKIEFLPRLENDLEFTHKTEDGTPYTVWIGSETTNVNNTQNLVNNSYGTVIPTIPNNQSRRQIVVSMLHWRKNILKDFLEMVREEGKQEAITTVSITTIKNGYNNSTDSKIRPLSSVILPLGIIQQVTSNIERFLNGSAWYAAHGIPYRYGLLLEGIPGCGKTSLAHALAGRFRLPIICITSVNEIINIAANNPILGRTSNHIVLLEDIDCQTQNRNLLAFRPDPFLSMPGMLVKEHQERAEKAEKEFEKKQWDLTFSNLLNFIDGVSAPEGRILIMTTNHKEQLDPALIRPGRINMSINFSYATVDQIARAIQRFYHSDIDWLTEHSKDVEQTYVSDEAKVEAEQFMEKLHGRQITMSGITNHFMNNKDSFAQALSAELDVLEGPIFKEKPMQEAIEEKSIEEALQEALQEAIEKSIQEKSIQEKVIEEAIEGKAIEEKQ